MENLLRPCSVAWDTLLFRMGMVEYDTMHAVVGQGMTMYRSADETIEQYYAAGVLTSIQGKFFGPQWS